MEIHFIIPGDPKTQQRHRTFSKKMNNGKSFTGSYDPSAADKKTVLSIAQQYRPATPIEGPISMTVKLFYQRPKNHYGSGKNSSVLKATSPTFNIGRPDADNAYKLISDALNSVFYRDDSQVCMLQVIKLYSETPHTDILIETL